MTVPNTEGWHRAANSCAHANTAGWCKMAAEGFPSQFAHRNRGNRNEAVWWMGEKHRGAVVERRAQHSAAKGTKRTHVANSLTTCSQCKKRFANADTTRFVTQMQKPQCNDIYNLQPQGYNWNEPKSKACFPIAVTNRVTIATFSAQLIYSETGSL